jgi:uncharacterized protein (TIGR01777 family)
MRIAVTGSSGLIGSAVVRELQDEGHEVVRLVRRPARPGEVRWDPAAGRLEPADLAGVDAAVHLAGAGIGDRRWTPEYRQTIKDSRVNGTRLLARTLASLPVPPRVLLSGSAVGWYGDTGSRTVTEQDGPGTGFLADVCRAWEAAAQPASAAGIRTVLLRTGVVLSRTGGALARQLPLFRFGLGGRLGSGRQYLPWISLRDQVAAIRYLLTQGEVTGPVNLVAPHPVTNQEFTRALGQAVHRPALLRVPGWALEVAIGDFAREGVLAGQRALPRALLESGFTFQDPDLPAGLEAVLHDPLGRLTAPR